MVRENRLWLLGACCAASLIAGCKSVERFLAPRVADVEIPRGTPKEDQFFGRTETFRRLVRIRVPVSPGDAARGSVKLKVTSQGCADVGVCYVPLEQSVQVRLPR